MSRQESEKFIEEARLLLPWYLTNNLSDKEQNMVNRALEASPALRDEIECEEKMMQLVKENTSALELVALNTTEQRLDGMLARIEREEQSAETAGAAITSIKPAVAETTSGWFGRLFERRLFDIEWLSPANAVFASFLALQAGALAYYQFNHSDTIYTSASVTQSSVNSANQLFLMEFQAGAQYGEVCDFLNKLDARIVSGPTNQNVFTVEMPTLPNADIVAFTDSVISQASEDNAPMVFFGPKFSDQGQ